MKTTILALMACLFALGLFAESNDTGAWSSQKAAAYLDGRSSWWITWKPAARDHDTFCISCHTALPYALARPALRTALGEPGPSENERKFVENVGKRVRLWNELAPLYTDEKNGAPKSAESRGTEAVMNALVLASYDARDGKLSDDTKLALANMWALQLKTGEQKGAWTWLNFHNEPWEADDSQFWGASLGALAVGFAPADYRSTPEVRENVRLLGEYLRKEQSRQSLVNRVFLLWASTKIPGLLDEQTQKSIIGEVLSKQEADGGWSTSSIIVATWKRRDGTALETKSDGYATGLLSFVLEQAGISKAQPAVKRGLAWLSKNQDQAEGQWPATSLNKQRDPVSDAGRFMSDAATAYAVLALTASR